MYNKGLPENYFKTLQSKIVQTITDIDDNIELDAPILSKINKNNIYRVPENYFVKNHSNIINNQRPKIRKLSKRIIGIAASFLIMITVPWILSNDLNQDVMPSAELSETVFIDYLIENPEDIDNAFFISLEDNNENEVEMDLEEITNDELNKYMETIVDELSFEDLEILNI